MAWSARNAWLSLTPEPERELPAAVATLRAGAPPLNVEVERERARVNSLVVSGSRRRWLAYLNGALELAERSEGGPPAEPAVAEARAVALDVVRNHRQLQLGIENRGDA